MLVIATPALSLRTGVSDAGNDPGGATTRKAYDLLAQGFGPGANGPLVIVAQLPRAGDPAALEQIGSALHRAPREQWSRSGDPSLAVVEGVATTGRVITAAATIMVCVFLAFVLGPERAIKLFGLSLASAVFLDAFVVRSLLLPAVLQLLGRWTWAFPDRLTLSRSAWRLRRGANTDRTSRTGGVAP